jgi:5-methylcytosine-specific restriction protein A
MNTMIPDGLGGEPTLENCKVYCATCADIKTETEDKPRMAKADRVAKKHYGQQKTKWPFPGSKTSKPMNNPAVRR